MSAEFDYQWKNLPSKNIEYNADRVVEFLRFTCFDENFLKEKSVLDAGCGNGRYTYAMQQLGATVDSIDISQEAINACSEINPKAHVLSIFDLDKVEYDFILCWGVLHHTKNPRVGFDILTSVLKPGGRLHVMLYRNITQKRYVELREQFILLDKKGKLNMCKKLANGRGNVHGWYDALNPKYNHSYSQEEIIGWYKNDYTDIVVMSMSNININGEKK